jgi:hypothetical protein
MPSGARVYVPRIQIARRGPRKLRVSSSTRWLAFRGVDLDTQTAFFQRR